MSSSAPEKERADETAAAEEEEEKIVLRSSDGQEFEVCVAAARRSGMISNMIDDDCVEGGVPVPNVKSACLSLVLEYLKKKHATAAAQDFREFEEGFFSKMSKAELFEVVLAANFLHAQELLDAACQCVADRIRDKTVQEVRDYFSITNDFTPEEEEEVRKENAWAFD